MVSTIAQTIDRQHVGVTAFNNELEKRDISAWKVDSAYEDQLEAALKEVVPAITVIRKPYSSNEFAPVNQHSEFLSKPAFGPNWSAIKDAVSRYCGNGQLDGVLMVARSTAPDFLGGTNQSLTGIGIYTRGPGTRVSMLYAIAVVGLIDCTSATPIAIRQLAKRQKGWPGEVARASAVEQLDSNLARTPISDWTHATENTLRSYLINLPKTAWIATVRSMFATEAN
ncbi:MAG TPA: hypothetical protein VFS42_04490 [Burkholderiaceae bacterium]|nr:hypothetical protein [Burkholderiaceae bacterium]